jgi:hypothetical protein
MNYVIVIATDLINGAVMTDTEELPQNPWHDEQFLIGGLALVNEELAAFLENLINVKVGTAKPMQSPSLISLGSKMVETGNALQMLGLRRFIEATPTSAAETT